DCADVQFFIHVDKKVDINSFKKEVGKKSNVIWIKERLNVQWGGWNQVRYQMLFLQEAFEKNIEIERLFIITGQDYPLWSNRDIAEACGNSPNKVWMIGQNLTQIEGFSYMKKFLRIPHLWRDVDFKSNRLRRYITGLQRALFLLICPNVRCDYLVVSGKIWDIWQSSGYFSCNKEVGLYILNVLRKEKKIVGYFKYSFVPEEMVIPTIIFNSVYQCEAQIVSDNKYRGLSTLAALHKFIYTKSIKVFAVEDYKELKKSNKMFIRKVETGISDSLVDRIENDRKCF
ncbi:MAG: beta-1,6-N-acetylglucosaminyltransferase, partial [Prevotella sp.]|nr:beta-1,6-N-acetylglucosaminyltransferase [Prevotella sp.]